MNTSWLCVDASLVVRLVTKPRGYPLRDQWTAWEKSGMRFTAPGLLWYEVTNALYQYGKHGTMSADAIRASLDSALSLPVVLTADSELHIRSLHMAERFSLPAAYDAHYLALADQLGAELWTLDRRLARAVGDRFPWVRVWQA